MSFLLPRSHKEQRKVLFHFLLLRCENLPIKSGRSVYVKWRRGTHLISGQTSEALVNSTGTVSWPPEPFSFKATIMPKSEKKISFSLRQKDQKSEVAKLELNLAEFADKAVEDEYTFPIGTGSAKAGYGPTLTLRMRVELRKIGGRKVVPVSHSKKAPGEAQTVGFGESEYALETDDLITDPTVDTATQSDGDSDTEAAAEPVSEEPFISDAASTGGAHESNVAPLPTAVPTIEVSSLDDANGATGAKRYRTANKDNRGMSAGPASGVPTPAASDEPSMRELASGVTPTSNIEESHADAADERLTAKEKARKERELSKAQEKEAKKLKKLQKEAAAAASKEAKEAARTEQQLEANSQTGSSSSSSSSAARKQEEKELKNKLEQSRQKVIELQKRVRIDEETLANMEQRFTKQEQELKLKHAKEIKALKKQLEPSSTSVSSASSSSSSVSSSVSPLPPNASGAAVAAAAAAVLAATATTADSSSSDKSDKKKSKSLDRDKSSKEKEEELQRLRKILAQLKTKYEEATQHNAKVKQQNIELKEQLEAAKRTIDEQAHRLRQEATCGGVLDDVPPSSATTVAGTSSSSNSSLSSGSKSLLSSNTTATKLRTRRHRLDLDDADFVRSINDEFTMFVARRFLYIMVFLCVWSLFSVSSSASLS